MKSQDVVRRHWRDGTAHFVFEPLELIEKLVALVPFPRSNRVRYSGVVAPRSYTVQEAVELSQNPRLPKLGDTSPVATLREMLDAQRWRPGPASPNGPSPSSLSEGTLSRCT